MTSGTPTESRKADILVPGFQGIGKRNLFPSVEDSSGVRLALCDQCLTYVAG